MRAYKPSTVRSPGSYRRMVLVGATLTLSAALVATRGQADDTPASQSPAATPSPEAVQNARMATLEGSKSPWSGQFQLSYSGSSRNHPFSDKAPNPGHEIPEPLVTLSGVFSARYRIDPKTTFGIGTGVITETPFQGPKHTSLSDPQIDLARSFSVGPIHNRVDATLVQYTNHQSYQDGYRQQLDISSESFYEFESGVTLGLALAVDGNTFASKGDYDKSKQTEYDFAVDPYFEYALNQTFNLRSVIGIVDYHNRDIPDPARYTHPAVYQTFGLGISATKSVFLYAFVKGRPYSDKPMTSQNTTAGFSTIINLF